MATTVKIQISPEELARSLGDTAKNIEQEVRKEVRRRAQKQVPIEVRNATIVILSGKRSGRRYGKHIASAPGEAPAVLSNTLRLSHLPFQRTIDTANGLQVISGAKTNVKYADTLDQGYDDDVKARRGKNKKYVKYHLTIKPRPYVARSKKKALVKIKEMYRRPYR